MALTLAEKALWRVRDLIFARPADPTPIDGRIVVAGLFRAASGVGEGARACAAALEACNVDVARVDLSEAFEQCDLPADPRCAPMPAARSGTVILHVNAPETDRALLALRLFQPRRWRVIGYWVWETPMAPASWARPARRLSEIWTPSAYAAAAIESVAAVPVSVVPHYVAPAAAPDITAARTELALAQDRLICLTLADGRSSFHRKNPLAAIEAFKQAFGDRDDARLIVKIRGVGAAPAYAALIDEAVAGDPRISLLTDDLSHDDQRRLLQASDILISLHRAEGFGLPMAEAMAMGKAVVATGWSGNCDFMSATSAALVPFELAPITDPTMRYEPQDGDVWAEPDIAAASEALRELANDPERRKALGVAARDAIEQSCHARNVAAALAANHGDGFLAASS